MSLLEAVLPTPQTVLYLGNIALAVVWLCATALLAASVCRRRSAPTCHGLLLSGLVLVLASPALVWVAGQVGIGRFQVALSERREPIDKAEGVPDTPRPVVDARQEPLVTETEAAWEHPLFVADRHAIVPDTPVETAHIPRAEPVPLVDPVVTPEETARATTTPWWLPIARGLVVVWALGTAISLLWLARNFVRLAAFCRGLREHLDDDLRQTVAQAAAQVGLARPPRLLVSSRAVVPVTLGLFRPAVVLPETFADDLPPGQCRAVLLHEMAHVARRDSWAGLAQRLAVVLYWWCPLVYWLNRRLADLREEVCDNYVLRSQGDGGNFAEVLVTLAERVVKPSPLPATVSVFEHHPARKHSHALEHRIRRLLSTETNPMTRMNRAGALLVVLGGLGMAAVIALSHVRAAEADVAVPESSVTNSPALPATVPNARQNDPVADTPANPTAPRKRVDPFGAPEAVGADPLAPPGDDEDDSEQGKLIAEIRKLGVRVSRDSKIPGRPATEVQLFGKRFTDPFLERLKVFDDLRVLELAGTRMTGSGVIHLKELNHLRRLVVIDRSISSAFILSLRELQQLKYLVLRVIEPGSAGLERLGELTQLEGLEMCGPIRDAEVASIRGLTQLRSLNLADTQVTDSGLAHLDGLTKLETLDLPVTALSDTGLGHLQGLPQLETLDLSEANVTDSGLRHLRALSQLRTLNLSDTKITDAGLVHLGGLAQLADLDLTGIQVTDDGLKHLGALSGLQVLRLDKTEVSDATARRFKRARPRVRVEPGILVWGWDRPGRDADVRLTSSAKKIVSALWDKTRVEFVETPLEEVVAFLQDVHDIPIQFDELRLRAAGIGINAPVTRSLTGISLYSALPRVLAEFGLTYVVGENALIITTPDEEGRLARQGRIGAGEVTREFEKNRRAIWVLQDKVRLRLTAMPLGDARKFLERQYGISIGIEPWAIDAAGIRPDVPCTINVKDVPLASALRKLFGDVGLTYVVEDGFIFITAPKKDAPADARADPAAPTKSGGGESERARQMAEIEAVAGFVIRDEDRPGQPVITVTLTGDAVTDGFLERLKVLDDLETLILGPSRVTEAGLTHLKGLRQLRALYVTRAPVSDAFLNRLQELPQLEKLSLRNNQLGDASLKQLKGLLHLKELSLSDNPIHDEGLVHLAALPQLERLGLSGTFVTDAGVGHLSRLPRLQYIGLSGTRITGVGLEQLEKLTELRELNLGSTSITDAGLKRLGKLTQLSVLGLSRTEVSDSGLEHLGGLTQLTSLGLGGTNVTDAGLVHLRGMTRLESLDLGTHITDAGLEHLSGLTGLVNLNLSRTKVTDAGLAHLNRLTQLQRLDLSYTGVTSAGLKHLGGMMQLQKLDLTRTKVTEDGLRHLSGMTKLEDLDLPDIPLSDIGLSYLQGLSQLHELNLSGGDFTDSGLRHLRGLSQLYRLDLSDTKATDGTLEYLGGLKQLTSLNLTNTKTTDAGLTHLAESTRLAGLILTGTQVTDAGLRHLSGLTRLQYLDLRETEATDDGLKHLGELTRLQHLALGKTEVTGTGLGHLGELPKLRQLHLDGSKANVASVWEFKRARPKVSIHPWTLTWGWDNPARAEGVHFTPTSKKILSAVEDDTRVECVETPLDQVTEFLATIHDIPIQLDEPTLRAAGIGIDVPVTHNLRGITLHSALRILLGQLGLTYVIREDALVITTVKEGQRLAQKGVINVEEVGREHDKRGIFRRSREKSQTELRKRTRLQFTETPLADVVAFLKEQHDILFVVDQRALAAAGIRPDVRCTSDVEGVPLGSALRKLLGDVGLTYVVDNEFILITTAKKDAPKEAPAKPSAPAKVANPFGLPKGIAVDPFAPPRAGDLPSEQGKVIAEIRKLNGTVWRDRNSPGQPVIQVWLRGDRITDAFLERLKVFDSLQKLSLMGSGFTEAGLMHLKGIRELRTLAVAGPSVSNAFLDRLRELPQLRDLSLMMMAPLGDASLEHVSRLAQLRSLELGGKKLSDAGLAHLRGMTQLQWLRLYQTSVTEAGLQHLSGLTKLEKLDIGDIPLSDAGLAHLQGLSQLERLDLRGANVTDSGLRHMRRLSQLQRLYLAGTQITDDGLVHLGGLKQLAVLDLTSTQITDDGLKHLHGLTRLQSLWLENTKVTDTAARQFKRALPRVRIEPAILVWGWDRPTGDADARLTPNNKKILSALRDDTRLEFIETPLKDITAFLQQQHDIPIQLDEPRLRAAGIGANVPVTRNIWGIALYSALRMILAEIDLTYVIGEDALTITTVEGGTRLARQGKIGVAEVSREFQKNSRIHWVLQDEVSLQFTAMSLEDVVDSLERQYSISIGFDRRALAAAGIRPDVPCTLDVKDIPLESALRKLLGDLGLTYVVDDEFIVITVARKDAPAEDKSK